MYASYKATKAAVDHSEIMRKYNVVFVLGGPGAGKGTQCEKIVENFGYAHLSAGELLREERKRQGSEYGEIIEGHITNGTIVPVAITVALLKRRMGQLFDNDAIDRFLIDGFPRNEDNLTGWIKSMEEDVDIHVNLQRVLYFNCSDQVCIDRCMSRGAAGSGRSDDNMESLKKRLVTYHTATQPIIEHYNKQNLVSEIDASKTPDEIFEVVRAIFEGLKKFRVVFVLGGPGAGKGTQCSKIVEKYGYAHLSAGDLLREERQRPGSEFGEEIEGHITNGTIVPIAITIALLKRRMNEILASKSNNKFLIDWFSPQPRQQQWLDSGDEARSQPTESALF